MNEQTVTKIKRTIQKPSPRRGRWAARNKDGESEQAHSRGSDEANSSVATQNSRLGVHLIRQARIVSGTLSHLCSAPDTFPCEGKAFGQACSYFIHSCISPALFIRAIAYEISTLQIHGKM